MPDLNDDIPNRRRQSNVHLSPMSSPVYPEHFESSKSTTSVLSLVSYSYMQISDAQMGSESKQSCHYH